MSVRRHHQFVALIHRLYHHAHVRQDQPMTAALGQCLTHMTGGERDCPIGQLLLTDYLETGLIPDLSAPPLDPLHQSESSTPPLLEQLTTLHRLTLQEATREHDLPFRDALFACQQCRYSQTQNPFHALLSPDHPSQNSPDSCPSEPPACSPVSRLIMPHPLKRSSH